MKRAGYGLITLSFLGASLVAVWEVEPVRWAIFIPLLAVGFVGVVIVQRGIRLHARAEHRMEENIQAIRESLRALEEKVARLDREKSTINVYDLRHRIDDELLEDFDRFVEARETIAHQYGLQAYADVMSHFAAGERYVNRVWSCSADGYVDESHAYIGKAHEQLTEALERLRQIEKSQV